MVGIGFGKPNKHICLSLGNGVASGFKKFCIMTYWNNNVILSLLIVIGCSRGTNKKLQEDFVSKYEQRAKNNSGLNCHSYFLKTIELRPEDTYFEYFIFFQDGTLFFNYGDSISYIKESTIFSIDSIERKKINLGIGDITQ